MKTIKGTVKLIGNRRTTQNDGLTISVLEIGNTVIKNVAITDYLDNYLNVGEDVEVLVYKGILQKRFIAAIKVDKRTYKTPIIGLFIGFVMKTFVFAVVFVELPDLFTHGKGPSFLIGCLLTAVFSLSKIRDLVQLMNF